MIIKMLLMITMIMVIMMIITIIILIMIINDDHNDHFGNEYDHLPRLWLTMLITFASMEITITKHGDHYHHPSGQPSSYKRFLLNSTAKHRQWNRSLKNLSNTLPQWGGDFAKSKVEIVEISENKKEKSKVEMCRWCWTMSSSTGCISSLTPPGT